jgi:hypothetical protein
VSNGYAALVEASFASIPRGVSFHDGYAPNPPASTLAPFLFDGADIPAVTRDQALLVPAYARGRALIADTVASFPLDEWRDGVRLLPPRPLLVDPDPDTGRRYTLARTVEDLVDYGRAWWEVVERDLTGRASVVRHATDRVEVDPDGRVTLDGIPVPADRVLRFDHDPYGALARGARILRTALALERAAERYARSPAPRTILRGTGEVHLSDGEATALLDAYDRTVRARGTAYVDAVELDQVGWNASELQLVEARRHTAGQIANLLGVEASWLGASESGSSLTYTNRQDLYRGLVDLTLRPYLDTIEQRLTRDDVSERGRVIRWNLDGFLRGNVEARAQLVTSLLPLDVLTRDEARALLDLDPTTPEVPA